MQSKPFTLQGFELNDAQHGNVTTFTSYSTLGRLGKDDISL